MGLTTRGVILIGVLFLSSNAPRSVQGQTTGILAPGYKAETIITGLTLPTQITYGPDGAIYVSELNGGENDAVGRIVRIEKPGASPQVLIENLLKPTGLTFTAGDTDRLYIAARERLLVSAFKDGKLSAPKPVFTDALPFNGRSEGQLAIGPDGSLYFQSTGTEAAPRDSGFIYTLQPGTNDRKVYARGFKNAYSFAWNSENSALYVTEIGDGAIPGGGQPPEELNVAKRGGDYGWPQCYADQQENTLWGGNRNICADTDVPLALFPPQSTPTAVAWFDNTLIVALFNGTPPRLVQVDPKKGTWKDFSTLGQQPIGLFTEKSGALLVLDFADGTVTRITKAP